MVQAVTRQVPKELLTMQPGYCGEPARLCTAVHVYAHMLTESEAEGKQASSKL